jgi:hypothetical protein
LLKHESDQKEAFKLNEPGSSEDSTWWRKVWNLKVPPKVQIFWWRVLQGFLPSKSELKLLAGGQVTYGVQATQHAPYLLGKRFVGKEGLLY